LIDVSCKRVCRASRKANDVIAKMGAQSFISMVSEPIRLRTDYIYVSIASSGVCDGEVTHFDALIRVHALDNRLLGRPLTLNTAADSS
jgi:hypothetical protein